VFPGLKIGQFWKRETFFIVSIWELGPLEVIEL